MQHPMSEDYACWSSPVTMIWCWQNTLGEHKASQYLTCHAPSATPHQMGYIMVQNSFRSGIRRTKMNFPDADAGNDHVLVILNFRVKLKKIKKHMNSRLMLTVTDWSPFHAWVLPVSMKFATLLMLDEGAEALTRINALMTEKANEILGENRRKTQPWVTEEILGLCDQRRDLKKTKDTTNVANAHSKLARRSGKVGKRQKKTGYKNSVQRTSVWTTARGLSKLWRISHYRGSQNQHYPRQTKKMSPWRARDYW